MMNKRVLRKFAIPSSIPNPKNGIFCADQVKYVVRTAIKNIDHTRSLDDFKIMRVSTPQQ